MRREERKARRAKREAERKADREERDRDREAERKADREEREREEAFRRENWSAYALGWFGVDPISWTPDPLGRRYPPCRSRRSR